MGYQFMALCLRDHGIRAAIGSGRARCRALIIILATASIRHSTLFLGARAILMIPLAMIRR
ncbi:MAG: hypothetical protein GDA52_07435 [Rhodobacteraceae bacterium]|nr:hypothetical protein [Paracoccaceae bacterium]